jgi:hypothetical protein
MEACDTKTNCPLTAEKEKEICKRLWEISDDAVYEGDTFGDVLCDSLKWYDHHDDMIALSKEFPDVMFMLKGEGEDRDDNWRLFVQNGEWEEVFATIVWNAPSYKKFQDFRF